GEAPELKQKAEAYLDGLKNAEGKKTSVAFRVGYGHTNEAAIQNWKITGRGEKPVPEALDRRILVLEPLEKLSKSSTIFVEVKEGIQGVEGNLPGAPADFRFNTAHEFFVRDLFGPDTVNPASPGSVQFSTEVSWADLKDGVFLNEMDPENPARVLRTLYHPERKSKDIPRYYSSSLWLGGFNIRPSATYQLHILKGVTNRLGDPLPADFHYTFQTANFPQYLRTITGVSLQESYFPKKIRIDTMNLKTIQVGVADLDGTTIAGYANRHDRNDSFTKLKEIDLKARLNQPSQYDLVLGDKKDEDQIFYYEVKAGDDFPNSFVPRRQPLYKGLMQVTSLAIGCKAGY
ncbi:MAG: hypothetical protein JNM63_16280, partial [Spirochaetia bacterium]|nr:hypothetical protein [Spirochaetia bacterium]